MANAGQPPTGNPEKPNIRFSTELKGHVAPVEQVAFNPVRDAELCSVSSDGIVKFWDVRTKGCVNEVKDLGSTFTLAWKPDGESLIVGNKVRRAKELGVGHQSLPVPQNDMLYVLSPTKSSPVASHQQPVGTNQVSFSWAGKNLFTGTTDGRTRILSFPDLEPLLRMPYDVGVGESTEFTLKGHTSACVSVEMCPTGRYLATGGLDSVISLWNTSSWVCKHTITSMAGPVRTLSKRPLPHLGRLQQRHLTRYPY